MPMFILLKSVMAGKQKIKNRKYKAILLFTATILFSFLLIVLPIQAVEMGEIRSGETKNGNIAIAGQTDSFKFYGEEGEAVVIKIVDINKSDFIPKISLYGPDNKESRWTSDFTVATIENYQLQQTGVHTIVVQDRSSNMGEYNLSLMLTGKGEICPYDCCASESGYEVKLCQEGYHCEYPHKCVKNKQDCPYDCCISESDYKDKLCSSGYNCENNKCVKNKCPYECCINNSNYEDKLCSFNYSCINYECIEDKINEDEKIKNNELFCKNNQVMFQGKCVEISSLFRKDEERISKEEYRSIIEKFDILKKEDREKLEKLAVYLEGEIKKYLDKREYEEAKTYTSLLEITFYQLENENKINETKKKYEEIKRQHFLYKLTHPFNDPLEVFSAIFFEILISSIFIIKKIKKENISLFKFIIKYWHKLIAVLIAFFIILWAAISIVLTILK